MKLLGAKLINECIINYRNNRLNKKLSYATFNKDKNLVGGYQLLLLLLLLL